MTGSVAGLLRYFAETEPQQLDAMVVQVQREAEDPGRQGAAEVEARRRLLVRIDEARRQYV